MKQFALVASTCLLCVAWAPVLRTACADEVGQARTGNITLNEQDDYIR